MCFSAQASFSTAVVLSVLGAFTLSKAKTKSMWLFATIPLLFACQQALEGVVWITFKNPSLLHQAAITGYLFFASMFWPVWMPCCLYVLEQNPKRKKMLLGIGVIGLIFAIIYAVNWNLMGISAVIEEHHISYPFLFAPFSGLNLAYIQFVHFGLWITYCLCTIFVFFCSSIPLMGILGLFIGVAFVIAEIFYRFSVGSVWCFFSAILSLVICYIVMNDNKSLDI